MPENCLPDRSELPYWLEGEPRQIEPPGKASTAQNWILLTFSRLAKSGMQVSLSHRMPDEGVVIAMTGNLPKGFRAPAGVYLVGIVADGLPHPACHFHVLQNAAHAKRVPRSVFLPHWPQPGLIARDPGRGDRFDNMVFYGDPINLAPEFRDPGFAAGIRDKFGITLVIPDTSRWHDYSETDAVLAIRALGSRPFLRKPATKLYNSWLAEVPFLGGSDSAFSADGCPGLNYLRCTRLEDVDTALQRLRDDPDFRRRLVREGYQAAERFLPANVCERWAAFLNRIEGMARDYFSSGRWSQKVYGFHQQAILQADRLLGGY